MSQNTSSFHIQHIARPVHLERILGIVTNKQPFDTNLLHNLLTEDRYNVTYDGVRRSLDLGAKLGIFSKGDSSVYSLTSRGGACQKLALYRRDVYYDVMHFILFATWKLDRREEYWSWSYQKICELFWRAKPEIVGQRNVFRQLSAAATKSFPDLEPVVGTETVYAVSNWIREMAPPFFDLIDDKPVSCKDREWFSVELALLSVYYLYSSRSAAISTPILLDRDTLESLCPLCLTSTDRILSMIETASRTFPYLNIHTGEWGSSVILQKPVHISEL
jgi:hypothetical protein